jgi:fatty-acyl-CoA synthase
MGAVSTTIGGMFGDFARRYGDLPMLADASRTVTYRELYDVAGRIANALRAAGVEPGDRVAVFCDDRIEAVEALAGCWLAGGVVVHINARLAAPEVRYQLEDSEARALCFTPAQRETVDRIEGLEDLAALWELDHAAGSAYATLLEAASPAPPPEARSAEDAAIIGYTSGTSGRPKGAVVSHRALTLCSRVMPLHVGIPLRSRHAYSVSLAFVGSVWGQVLPHFYVGGMVRLLGQYDVESWFAAMRADRSTYTYLPTPMFGDFAEQLRLDPGILQHLTSVMHAGSLAPRPQVEEMTALLGDRYVETYGMTEIVGSVTATTPGDYTGATEAEDVFASAGRTVPTARAWIIRQDGSVADPGEEGEIVAEADTAFSGYFNDEAKTADVFDGRSFRTGDAGRIDAAGYLYVTGRRSELILSGGMNVYPAEVERALLSLAGIRQAAVIGMPHERWGETVVAAVVADPAAGLDAEAVIAHCRAELASYKKPTRVEFVGQIPLNAGQKIDKQALKELFARASA